MVRRLVIRKSSVVTILVSCCVVLGSLILSPFYVEGDQEHYIAVYEEMANLALLDAYQYYIPALSSTEVVHFGFSWIFSRLVDKDVFVSIFNGILAYLTLRLMSKYRVSPWISSIFVLTNFYAYVCYFAAERLKFGLLFGVLALLFRERIVFALLAGVTAVLAHAQMLILGAAVGSGFLTKIDWRKLLGSPWKWLAAGLVVTPVLFLAFGPVSEQVTSKLRAYDATVSFNDFAKGFAFYFMALMYSKSKLQVSLVFVPIMTVIGVVGGERVIIFAYFAFLFYALQVRQGRNVAVVATLCYFALKAYFFVQNVVAYGDGFY